MKIKAEPRRESFKEEANQKEREDEKESRT